MTWLLIIISVSVILFILFIALALFQADRLKKGYGPQQPVDGSPCASGSLICRSWRAPTLGKKLEFAYHMTLQVAGDDLTGEYHYPPDPKRQKTIYSGEIFLTYSQGQLTGRSNHVVTGKLTPQQADLRLGVPPDSWLSFLNGPVEFYIDEQTIRFVNTGNSQDVISRQSRLTITGDTIAGQLGHTRESWLVDVEVTYQEVAPELAAVAVILINNDILDFHHD